MDQKVSDLIDGDRVYWIFIGECLILMACTSDNENMVDIFVDFIQTVIWKADKWNFSDTLDLLGCLSQ